MTPVKKELITWIRTLPDNGSVEDVRYYLYVRKKVEQGLEALEEGRVIPQEEAKRRMGEWLKSFGRNRR